MWLVPTIIIFDLGVAALVVGLIVNGSWGPLTKEFPQRTVIEPKYRRRFQSFQIGWLGLGLSVHTTIDDECLHLNPIKLLQWLGCKPLSIPWSQVCIERVFKHQVKCKIGKTSMVAPRWCVEPLLRAP
jgi:hypothetical protein